VSAEQGHILRGANVVAGRTFLQWSMGVFAHRRGAEGNMERMRKIMLQTYAERDAFPCGQEQPDQKPLVLLIEDSPTVRKIVEICLRREGLEVRSFPDGMQALSWLHEPGSRSPRLVLLDLTLPKMDGFTLASYLKSKPLLHGTPVVILSRREGALDRLKARLVGAQAYITKPFTTQHLLTVVHAHLHTS
jgi:twitching motility two-component system response regulator PilG